MLWKIWGGLDPGNMASMDPSNIGLAIGCPICETYQLNPTDDDTIPEDAPIFMTFWG